MNNNFTRLCTAKDEPRVALIAHAAISFEKNSRLDQGRFNAIKLSELLLSPILMFNRFEKYIEAPFSGINPYYEFCSFPNRTSNVIGS